jgi:adenosylcobinamide kinase / adenosylcobinamide-phosphate guanylyltransferase
VLGGARSGKSEVAERLADGAGRPLTYLATGGSGAGDPEWSARIEAHRERRGQQWATVEVEPGSDLAVVLMDLLGVVLVDSLGAWLAGVEGFGLESSEGRGLAICDSLDVRRRSGRATVVVSDEVGLGVHPSTAVGRGFRDGLGILNQQVASMADDVLFVIAGRTLALGPQSSG